MTEAEFELHILPCHKKMYRAAALIVSDADEATDIVQEAFTRLWERRNEIPNPDSPEGYCVTVVRRLSIDRLRRHQRMVSDGDSQLLMNHADRSMERSIEAGDSLRRVKKLMENLPDNQRNVIHLSAIQGLDNGEIAEATGLSDVNVRALLSRGRKMLRKLFERELNNER